MLSGRYVEAGDSGRHLMAPGDILIHRAWERHLDRVEDGGAEVLVLDLMDRDVPFLRARIADPDEIARLAETDTCAALDRAIATSVANPVSVADWPDELAAAIRADPEVSIGDWAGRAGLHLGSVSRGFRQVFGITPKAYRLTQRTLRALDLVSSSRMRLSAVAHDCRFADQAHMARAIRAATDRTAGELRRR